MADRSIIHVQYVVRDYDEAISFFTGKLDFELVEDRPVPEENKRWVVVRPRSEGGCSLVLGKAKNAEQDSAIGNQTGGRVFLFLQTDDFWRDYNTLCERGIEFAREPQEFDYGTVAVFRDLYGNLWDLVQYSKDRHRRSPGDSMSPT